MVAGGGPTSNLRDLFLSCVLAERMLNDGPDNLSLPTASYHPRQSSMIDMRQSGSVYRYPKRLRGPPPVSNLDSTADKSLTPHLIL
jgi:hypothetical protein